MKKILIFIIAIILTGCATLEKAHRADELELEVRRLTEKLNDLEQEKNEEIQRLLSEKYQTVKGVEETKKRELSDLEKAKAELEENLKKEISEYKAKLELTERGLVITFIAEIFFDSGKDVIRADGENALQKVALVLNKNVPDSLIAIEGHTDNEPIKYSGWKSNWELSSARALAVLHYFIDSCEVLPKRLSSIGYGEYKPVSSNDTPEGKQQNRRVEIVILPSQLKKIKP